MCVFPVCLGLAFKMRMNTGMKMCGIL
jgi:hypothetical protein